MYRKWIFSLSLFLAFLGSGSAQELISYEETGFYNKQTIGAIFGFTPDYDVTVYNITYTTRGVFNEPDTASGIIAVPVDPMAKFPTLLYDHGTVADRFDVPSQNSGEKLLVVALASYGYMSVAPDYIGLGISEGLHPYVHPESEASAGIDLIHAVKKMEESEPVHFNEQLFITGYSQGGHAAMATSKILQQTEEMTVTASAPMSGPYSISDVMRSFTLGNNEYFFCAYLGSVCLTALYSYPDLMQGTEVEDLFLPEYAALVRDFEKEEINLFEMNNIMIAQLSQNGGEVLPRRMFKEEVTDAVLNDPEYPLFKALQRMDVYDWVPEMPLKMLYCSADDQVSFRNAIFTDSLMNVMGAEEVSSADVLPTGDHGQCAGPATYEMLQFFGLYQRIDQLNPNLSTGINPVIIWPNPAKNKLYLGGELPGQGPCHIEIFDHTGSISFSRVHKNFSGPIDISLLSSGFYTIRLTGLNGQMANSKLVVVD